MKLNNKSVLEKRFNAHNYLFLNTSKLNEIELFKSVMKKSALNSIKTNTVIRPFLVSAILVIFGCGKRPAPTVYLGSNIKNWKSQFTTTEDSAWFVDKDRLWHRNSEDVQKLSLSLADIAYSARSSAYFTGEVQINGDFSENDTNSFCGFELSGMGLNKKQGRVFGVNGAGNLIVYDMDMNKIHKSVGTVQKCTLQSDSVFIFFTIYGNKKGCIVECTLENCTQNFYSQIMNLQFYGVMDFKEISLVAYNPDHSYPVWFKNLQIWRGWVPLD